ncbi:chaperone modulator CbpM [Pseudozobellia thermophila]|uniref:MerR HTH family regulatory protein n=1 Tax=Pseudozobellia thermophila TaxID=192903 RepID=A0A1M6EYV4_9FLAO|nr:chaperone modulator CbpM [Pseudozobellia thermophila]SHI90600.1 MerR HTH family regulatory protein [Pseudozobellia thermophila]
MEQENYILVKHYCEQTKISDSFIDSLHEYGLIEYKKIETETYISSDDINEIERIDRLHHELGINLEGIDALNHMLSRLREMESELRLLRNRLAIYEK